MPLDEEARMDIVELRVGFESMTNTVADMRTEYNRRFDETRHDTSERFDRQDIVLAKQNEALSEIKRSIDERRGRDQVKAVVLSAVGLPIVGWLAVWVMQRVFHAPPGN